MLVVVVPMARMAVLAVLEVHVVQVLDGGVAAALAMDVHVTGVGEVEPVQRGRDIVHVVHVQVMDVPVVEVVQVIAVGHRRVAAPAVMVVGVGLVGLVIQGRARRHGPHGRTHPPAGQRPRSRAGASTRAHGRSAGSFPVW